MLGVTVAMIVFVVSLLLDWFGAGDFGVAGTEARSWWLALGLAVIAGGIYAADALNFPPPTRYASLGVGALAATLVLAWAVFHAVDATEGPGGLKLGGWIGVIASAVGTFLAALVWSQERQ